MYTRLYWNFTYPNIKLGLILDIVKVPMACGHSVLSCLAAGCTSQQIGATKPSKCTCGAVNLAVVCLPGVDDRAHMRQAIHIYSLLIPVGALWMHLLGSQLTAGEMIPAQGGFVRRIA